MRRIGIAGAAAALVLIACGFTAVGLAPGQDAGPDANANEPDASAGRPPGDAGVLDAMMSHAGDSGGADAAAGDGTTPTSDASGAGDASDATQGQDASPDDDAGQSADGGACVELSACTLADEAPGRCCGAACVDVSSDPSNCGTCGGTCDPGVSCVYGVCGGSGGVGCFGCGTCGIVCPVGASCSNWACSVADGGPNDCASGAACPPGDVCALNNPDGPGNNCVPTTCGPGSDGQLCGSATNPYFTGLCCNQTCTNFTQDNANCGSCGATCASGAFCNGGFCFPVPSCATSPGAVCPLGPAEDGRCCAGACNALMDTTSCGQCGNVCPEGQVCASEYGTGACTLPDGGTGGCTDSAQCPTGNLCIDFACVSATCAPAQDGLDCAFGPTTIGTCCGGACVDTSTSPTNCGACGTSCGAGGICVAELGAFPDCLPMVACGTLVGGYPLQCATTCNSFGPSAGWCTATGGNAGACCAEGFDSVCSDLTNDPQNCGGCGFACPAGQTCTGGVCSSTQPSCGPGHIGEYCDLAAGTSFLCCSGGGCTDVSSDPANCGTCSRACPTGQTCTGGQCAVATCTAAMQSQPCLNGGMVTPGYICCGSACVDASSDVSNCGGCGTVCSGSTFLCYEGECVP